MNSTGKHSPRVKVAGLVIAVVATLLASARQGSAFTHVVQKSETLAGIAERIYGRIQYEKILMYANALDAYGGSAIEPGMRLEIPAVAHRRVNSDDTWQSLARDFLGDERRGEILAELNGAKPWVAPDDGAQIMVPYNLRYIATKEESIVVPASKFFADQKSAWMLDRYNNLNGHLLRRGDVVLVPLTDLPLTEAGVAEVAMSQAAVKSEALTSALQAQKRATSELPILLGEARTGHYVEAAARGAKLLALGELTRAQLADINRVLTECYVALDAPGLALTACQQWLIASPGTVLDPVQLSPKIVAACKLPGPGAIGGSGVK